MLFVLCVCLKSFLIFIILKYGGYYRAPHTFLRQDTTHSNLYRISNKNKIIFHLEKGTTGESKYRIVKMCVERGMSA